MTSIFYSWQSDSPAKTNRTFIQAALEEAIKTLSNDTTLDTDPRLDKDTQGTPGSPSIIDTILAKIDICSVFVADLTLIKSGEDTESSPNPNVLLEYGYALKANSSDSIVAVMNEYYGKPENLPFDLTHRRWPIRYSLPPDASKEIIEKQRKVLSDELVNAIKTILESKPTSTPNSIHQEIQPKWGNSSFLTENEMLVNLNTDNIKGVNWTNSPQLFIRLIPPNEKLLKPMDLNQLINDGALGPMNRGGNYRRDMNKYGAVAYTLLENKNHKIQRALNITQVFRNGEIWGINEDVLSAYPEKIPTKYLEQVFTKSLNAYLAFSRVTLRHDLPLKYYIGISGFEDFSLIITDNQYVGRSVENEIVHSGLIKDYNIDLSEILIPLFKEIWEACGVNRPDHYR